MAGSIRALGLYDLLAPEFLAGFTFPSYIDKYLSLLAVSGLSMTSDDTGVLYTGTVYFPTGTGDPPVTQHVAPTGEFFEWSDVNFQFRLRVWREASPDIQSAVNDISTASNSFQTLFNDFGDSSSSGSTSSSPGSDYPGVRFRLELLVSLLTFHLGPSWVPGVFDSTSHVSRDTSAQSSDVRVLLPKMLLRYEQTEDFSSAPTFALDSWGSSGFDAPSDLAEGELVTMDPPLAMHISGRVAFGVQDIELDLGANDTPPEILSHFGTGEGFEGVYIKALQFYYSDSDKDFAFNVAVTDALISFKGEVWLEAELDLMWDQTGQPNPTGLIVTPKFLVGNQPIQFNAGSAGSGQPNTYTGGSVSAPANVYVQLQVSGGVPPYTYAVDFTPAGKSAVHLWDSGQNQAHFAPPPTADESGTLVITVKDSTQGTPLVYTNSMAMIVTSSAGALPNGAPEDSPGGAAVAPATITWDARPQGIPDSYQVNFTPAVSGNLETLIAVGGPTPVTATATTPPATTPQPVPVSASGQILIEVDPGATVQFAVTFPAQNLPAEFDLLFSLDAPSSDDVVSSFVGGVPTNDSIFAGNQPPAGTPLDGLAHTGAAALAYWVAHVLDTALPIQIAATDSDEGNPDRAAYSQTVSERRGKVAQQIITNAGFTPADPQATGVAQGHGLSNPADRVAKVTGTAKPGQPPYPLKGTLQRPASPSSTGSTPTDPAATKPPQTPPAASNSSKPPSLKRLSFRVRLEKDLPVLLEVSGEIDFQKQTQQALQQAPGSSSSGSLELRNTPNATANPHAGDTIVDFTLNVTYDSATGNLTETLALGATPADQNGLLQMQNTPSAGGDYDTFKDIFGAVLLLTPILNAATTAIDPNSAGDWTDIAISLGPPVAIGGLGWINTVSATLYGGSLVVRENMPSGISSTEFTSAAMTFDYGVNFRFDINPLNIHSQRNLSVRYKAVGFSLDFKGSPAFKFVFDTSKGYTLDLSDPSLFNLPAPLGDILKIAEARIAQHNPLTLELDLVVKADLGVVTVDEFQIKIPFDGSAPMILPSGIHVNIPGAITGGGKVQIDQGGFEGSFDLTLTPLHLRVAASVGIAHVEDGNRSATAIFLGLEVDFPTPIILGDTGLGIFGLFGLFGMHYTRSLPDAVAGSAVSPDLQWLLNARGQPQNLTNASGGDNNPQGMNWVPKLGSWALGIGALLGTVDGYLLNLRGMVILELPGPQIIITVNLQIIEDLPVGDGGVDTDSLTVGILGILDIDFNLNQVTIGVSIHYDIEDLITINVPVSIFFSWNEPDQWHIWLGTIQTPVSANILGIVKGSGYLMIGGQPIDLPAPANVTLPGVAVAVGLQASVIWGSEKAGIYLEVVLGADLGVSFQPSVFIVGQIHVSGKLQLLIVSIGATGDFQVEYPAPGDPPVYLKVNICGSVSFFFFSVSACVGFTIGSNQPPPPPPPALISRMYLQSYAPVIPSGQGGDRPIDASLGDATEIAASGPLNLKPGKPSGLGSVPIDSVPVFQFQYAADASAVSATFTEPIPQCAALPTSAGGNSVSLGGKRTAVYTLKGLTIYPPLPANDPPPPTVWRKNTSANDTTATRVDLALFSRDPSLASHALERSTTLTGQLTSIWGGVCTPPAPPACVLWTFCGQRPGPSHQGWDLVGIPTPDPPGTVRSSPVPTAMHIDSPGFSDKWSLLARFGPLLGGSAYQPAQIIGVGVGALGVSRFQLEERITCFRGLELPELMQSTARIPAKKPHTGYFSAPTNPSKVLNKVRAELNAEVEGARWVRLQIGQATGVQLFMAIAKALAHGAVAPSTSIGTLLGLLEQSGSGTLLRASEQVQPPAATTPQSSRVGILTYPYDVLIRERDDTGTLLRESTLGSLGPQVVVAPNDLPAEWTDENGPWWQEIEQIWSFFDYGLASLTKVYVDFTPLQNTTVIEVAEIGPPGLQTPTVVIGAVVACPASDAQSYETALQVQQSQISTLQGYLDGGSPVPLLAPGTPYTITVDYDVTTTEADGSTNDYSGNQQAFKFTTDSVPPAKLDPWVMSCSPANNELNVFYDDPVVIVFNDQEAIQLWSAYGFKLVLDLRAADGLNGPPASVQNTASVSGYGPAGYDSLRQLIASGALPCVGETTSYQNQQYTADVQLRPTMAYTLDVVTDPAGPAPPPGDPVVPLYRTRFTTSKYASLQALATDLGGSRVTHRHLSGPLDSLTAPSGGASTQVSDQDIESAFLAAGEQALPAPTQNTIAIYWIPNSSGAYVPYCLLLDCTEPLWRWRQEPKLTVLDPSDPSFTIVEIAPTPALVVQETGGSNIAGYLYSTSGTRTIAFFAGGFAPAASGTTITLELYRPASQAFGLADSIATIVALPIGQVAPWEADSV